MENKNQLTGVTAPADDASQAALGDFGVVPEPTALDPDALSLDPTSLAQPPPDELAAPVKPSRVLAFFKRADVILALLVVVCAGAALLVTQLIKHSTTPVNSVDVSDSYSTQRIPLKLFAASTNDTTIAASKVTVNGSLTVTDSLVIAPSVQPNAPVSGQLYYDTNTNQLAYYNGTGYVALTAQGAVVNSLGGATGAISLGGGLSVVGNQLTVAFPQTTTGVTSFGGATGAITLGNGLQISGNSVSNSGVLTLTAGTPNLTVSNDGNGNLTISNVGGGSGTVTSGGGTVGRIAKFTGVQNVEDSLLSESGATVTANGNLAVTGALTLASALTVSSGGLGVSVLPSNGVLIGNGASAVTGVTAGAVGQCLVSTAGAPSFQACPGSGGVTTLNGLNGALTISNATGSVNTITIDDASAIAKGIASFNGTNFTVTGGAVNTAQNITSTSTPTFAGVNTNAITPSSTLTIGAAGQTLNLVGGSGSTFVANGGGFATTLGFTGTPTGAVTYNLDRAASAGTYTLCSTAGNCVGLGGTVSSTGGTTDRLSKFSGGQSIVDSSVSDNGTTVTVNGTANLVVQGGTGTFGTLTQAGTLVLSDGSSNTVSIVSAPLAGNRIITLPDAGGDATLCVNTGNCIGGTGSAPNTATYLVAALDGTLTNERALSAGSNLSLTDGGANGNMTVATVQNPTFTTSVTTPVLQSSGALVISSAAGTTVAIDAGTTIELQDSTNVTGSLDVSVALNVGTANAFQVSSGGAIAAATGITSSGTIVFSGLDCSGNLNGGALTTDASGQLMCSDDDGGAGGAISGSGTSGTIPVFSGTQTIANSIITQSGTTITVAGDLTLTTQLSVANGGTGATSFTTRGVLYGNGTGAVQVTAAGTTGQVLIANGSGVPTFATFSGDVAVSGTGVTTIQADSVALGTDTTGAYVSSIGTLTGLSTTGNSGEGSTPTLSVLYGSIANTAVQGNVSLTCPSGTGNLTGGGTGITLGAGGTCADISTVNNPTFSTSVTTPSLILTGAGSNGTIQVGTLGQGTVYTLPDPGAATTTICIATGNCSAAGAAGGDLTGSYPNPTIAKLQGTNLSISSPVAGHILVYNNTNGQWENKAITGDIAISESGAATIQANSVALGTDTTGNYVLGLTAGNGISVTGSAGEGWSPTVSAIYGSTANTAVEGNTSITVSAGTNLTGGGSITLGAGGTVTLNVANSPTFSGTLTVQGATANIGTTSVAGSVVLSDGSSNTGTVQTASLGQNTVYTLPDPGAGTATICLTTGNCAGTGGGVTTPGGSTNQLAKFTGSQTLGDSTISDDGSTVTINGTANLTVQGGTSTLGTLTQAGTLAISDGSSNTVSIVASGLSADRVYTLPDVGGSATFCLDTGNCIGSGGGGAPNDATYLVATLNGTLTNERALAGGTNISLTDGGAGASMTVATVNNPTFSTSVTTPALQSSGALVISSAAGNTVAIDAGTTIELQDSTNVTGSLDVSVALNVGTANAFQVSSGGAITAATGVTSSGTITFSGLNCTSFANGGTLTTNASGVLSCADDDGAAAGTITGSGTTGTVPLFSGTNAITNSIVTQSGTTITIAGDLTLTTQLSVANGGTGATSFTGNGVLYGNGSGALQVTSAGTGGQVLIANASGVPTFVSFSGDVAVSNTGVTTIQADSVALGTDTTGNYVATLGTLTGLSATGNTGEGSTPTLAVQYGSGANTAVQGNTTLTCPSGTGNLSGGGTSITLGSGGSCSNISIVNNPTFTTSVTTPLVTFTGAGSNGSLQAATLGQTTTYTLPDPGATTATICLSTGNCTAVGTAGGDLTGSYPNPTIAKLQSGTLTITSVASGNILQYNGSAWVNQSVSGDITLNSSGAATIQNNAVTSAKINDGTIVNADLASGSFTNITAVGTLTGLTVAGATSINTTGTANTAIGNATGTVQITSSGLNVSTGGALTGVTGITTSGGYTQSGTTANTLTGATSFTAAGTALSVTNNATVGGTLTVNTITPSGTLTVGSTGQTLTLQGNAMTTLAATDSGFTTTVGFATPTANTTLTLPALTAGSYSICTSSGNCAGAGVTLQTAYNNSTNPEITLDATRGALTVRDNSTPLGANLFEVQSNNGSTTYFNVTASGTNTTGTATSSGTINTTGGTLQTNSTTRIDNSGNLTNIASITAAAGVYSLQGAASASTPVTILKAGATPAAGAHLLSLQDSSSLEHGYFNNIGNALTLGRVAASGTVSQGQLSFADGTTDNFAVTVQPTTLTASRTITIPDATGTICLQSSTACGFALSSGSTNYIQNQNSTDQTADFRISGTGRANTSIQTPLVDTATAVALALGTTNATAINLNQNTTIAAAKTLTVTSGATSLTGATSGDALTVSNSTSTGNIAVFKDNSTAVFTIADGGTVLQQPTSNSTSAFNIKNAGGNNLFTVDTTNSRVGINLGSSTTPTLAGAGLQVQGSIRLSGTGDLDSYTTPVGGSYNARINIQNLDPGSFGQVIALGLTSTAQSTARGISLFDARTASHQQTLSVFSPDENSIIGLSWNGSNSNAIVATNDKTSANSSTITLQSGAVTSGSGLSTGIVYVLSGDGTGTNTSTGNIVIDSGIKSGSGTAGVINLGVTNATAVNISRTGVATTVGGTLTVTAGATSLTGATSGVALTVSNSTSTGNIVNFNDNSTTVLSVADGGAALFKNSSDSGTAFRIQNSSSVSLLSVSTLAGTNSAVQLYAPNAINSTTTEGLWLRAPKSAVTTLFGDNDSTAAYGANESSANLRFNGSGVGWGDFGYYPQGGGSGNYGQFRFSTTGSSIATTPNAKVGVGDLYVGSTLGIATTSPSYTLGFGTGASRTIGVETQTTSNTAGNSLTISSATGNGTGAGGALTLQAGTSGTGAAATGGAVTIQGGTGNGSGASIGGAVTIDAGSGASAGGAIAIGTTNATGITLGTNTATAITLNSGTGTIAIGTGAQNRTINIGTGAAVQTVSVGSTNGASATTISSGTGNMLLQTNSSSAQITVKSQTNGANAFQVQNAAGSNMLNVDTSTSVISVNTGIGGALTSWSTLSSTLNTGASFGSSAVANGYIYSIGGYSSAYQATVQYASLKSDGTIGTWATTTALPAARAFMMSGVAVYDNFIYVVGGSPDATNGVSTVYYARLHSDGTISAWYTTSALPANRLGAAVVINSGHIFALGGGTDSSTPSNTIYEATINSDGSITPWATDATTLPVTYSNASAVVANGKLYYMGGTNSGGTSQTGIYYATIDPLTGDVGSFTTNGTSLPTATSSANAILYNGYIYVMNGGVNAYYYAPVASAGSVGTWSSQISMSPMTTRTGVATNFYNGYFYAMGGFTGGAGQTAIYAASAARMKISGALDLVSATDGIVASDGSVGGSLTVGDATVVGKLNVQNQASFSQGVSIAGNLSLGTENEDGRYNTMTIRSKAYSGISLLGDTANTSGEPGGSFIDFGVDSSTTMGTVGITQTAALSPDGLTTVTSALANAFLVGSTVGSGATQILSGDGSGNGVARITVVNGATTRVCIAMTSCSNSTLGVTGTIKATSTITASTTPDLAETIAAAPDVEAADVVMADPDNTERVVKTTGAYQGAAVGVISDGSSSFMINSYGGDNFDQLTGKPLVLAGRVPVKVTMEGGAIKPGDYLTSSSTPGKAMKATHAGPTIGKALGFYDDANGEDGTVLALINVSYYSPELQGSNDGSFGNLNASGNVNIGGTLTVTGLVSVGNLLVNGHIVTAGNAPDVTTQAAAGSGATVTVTGNDIAGRITVTTGAAPSADDLAKLSFHTAYGTAPEIVITPLGKGSAGVQPYVDAVDAASFMLGAGQMPQPNTTYIFTYHVIGTAGQ